MLASISTGALLAEAPAGSKWKLAFSDEFDGKKVDTAKWVYRTDSKHWSTQKAENVSLSNGNLILNLKKEKAGDKEYTGAGVISKNAYGYGYYETRFKITAGKGWHSSFWMMKHDGSGGTNTKGAELELDVIENDSIDLTRYGVNTHKWPDPHVNYGHKNVTTTTPLSEYHVFGCEYSPEQVKYYLDGNVVQTVDITALPKGDLHIWLTSIASYLGKTDKVDESRLPGTVSYDYVRFYQKATK